ncbi:MAG: hypothetical protein PHV06_08120, partial [bacterium]|nr:hypothetical protein [bacterium]
MKNKLNFLLLLPLLVILLIGIAGFFSFEKKIGNLKEFSQEEKNTVISDSKIEIEKKLDTVSMILTDEFTKQEYKSKTQILNSFSTVEKKIRKSFNVPKDKDLLFSQRFYSEGELIVYRGFYFPVDSSKVDFAFQNEKEIEIRLIQDKLYNKILVFSLPINKEERVLLFFLFEDTMRLYTDFYEFSDIFQFPIKRIFTYHPIGALQNLQESTDIEF